MKSMFAAVAAILSFATASPAPAALAVGGAAPDFSTRGAQGGTISTISLATLLRKGPVVLYFFPSAFTETGECQEFAENIDRFSVAGVSILGMSRDSVETLSRFSAEECAGKFPLASADESLVNGFDVNDGATFNTRTTYVIAPSGKILFVHDADDDYDHHVKSALAFVQAMKK